jgi:hypothetical protein
MGKQLRFSRWRRLPGLHRITERKIPDHRAELQRLTLYVPGGLLDQAEELAARAGTPTVQLYCEDLLRRAIEAEQVRDRAAQVEVDHGPLDGLDAIANDLDYLAEWSASASTREHAFEAAPGVDGLALPSPTIMPEHEAGPAGEESEPGPIDAVATVLRHAAVGSEDPAAFLPTLRRGEAVPPDVAAGLLQALMDLERALADTSQVDRRLAYALHRLAFEGQILMTDAWPGLASDQATVDVLRMVQEAVDRILSGEDIRYYAPGPQAEPPT